MAFVAIKNTGAENRDSTSNFQGPCWVRGVVLGARGEAVVGARLRLSTAGLETTPTLVLTDTTGCFELGASTPGHYTLCCESDHHGAIDRRLNLDSAVRSLTLQLPL